MMTVVHMQQLTRGGLAEGGEVTPTRALARVICDVGGLLVRMVVQ